MKWIDSLCVFALSFGIVFCAACYAYAEVGFASSPVWLSSSHVTAGTPVQVSTVITKQDLEKVDGTVTFYANDIEIGAADFVLPSNVGGVVVAVSWVPSGGEYAVSAKVTRAVAGDKNMSVTDVAAMEEKIVVDPVNDQSEYGASTTTEGADATQRTVPGEAVAGASTTHALVVEATNRALPVGESVFETTEGWREKGKKYFDAKVAGVGNTKGFASTTNADLVKNPKEGVMGIWEMVQAYFFKAGAFLFSNIYAFYIFCIMVVLWLLRKIWRRYSLD